MANIPAPRGYFPPQTNLRVATPIVGQTGLPSNTNVQQPNPFFDMRPYQEFFGDPTRDLLASTRAAIAARTAQPTVTPQTRFTGQVAPASYMSPALSQTPSQQVTPRTPPSGLDQLRAAQLRMPAKGSPELAGLSAAAATGLQLSGYQDRPLTTGQIVGSMLGTYNEAQQAAAQRQADQQQQAIANQLAYLQLQQKMLPEVSNARQAAIDIGLDPDSPKGQQWMREYLEKPSGVQVNLGAEGDQLMQKFQIERGSSQISKMQDSINAGENIVRIYEQMQPLLLGGMKTGAFEETMLPVRNVAAALGFLKPDERDNLSDQELFLKLSKEASTYMRPAGSGATSDFEAVTYQTITAKLDNTPESNLKRIAGALQIHEYNKKKMAFYEDFFIREKTLMGANTEWDKQGITPFPNYMTPEETYNDLQSGNLKVGMMFINDDMNSKTAGFNLLTPELAQALEQKYGQ